jgi:lipooligosaccharide transport system ATP-binding protein
LHGERLHEDHFGVALGGAAHEIIAVLVAESLGEHAAQAVGVRGPALLMVAAGKQHRKDDRGGQDETHACRTHHGAKYLAPPAGPGRTSCAKRPDASSSVTTMSPVCFAAPVPEAHDPVVIARGLRKQYGELDAVAGIDLTIERATCVAMLGPNGAGKTTTIRMIQCVIPPTAGTLEVLGRNALTDRRAIKMRLGVVPQEDNLDPDFTVRKNLVSHARFYGIRGRAARDKADRLLGFVELSHKRDAKIDELSGGMKRRLVVARSLVNDPELLVLDEPTTGLDPQARHTIWDRVRALKREGKTVLLTTHYMDEAERLADRVIIIDKGKIHEEGTPRELIDRHTGGEAVEFVFGHANDGVRDALVRVLQDLAAPHEVLAERVLAYGTNTKRLQDAVLARVNVLETVLRRATLEDVFLRLTGRALRD